MKNSKNKGDFGYRNYHRRLQMFLVGLLLLAILAQLGARFLTDSKAAQNILTVMAILTVLPMANVASPLIASFPYRSVSPGFYELCRPYEEKFPILYDLIVTSKEQVIPVDAAAIHPSGVYLYCPVQKLNVKKAEQFFDEMLSGHRLEQNARIITEERTFFKRLDSLKAPEDEELKSAADAAGLLRSLSM